MSAYLPTIKGDPTEAWRKHLQSQSELLSSFRTANNLAIGSAVLNYLTVRQQTSAINSAIGQQTSALAGAIGQQTSQIKRSIDENTTRQIAAIREASREQVAAMMQGTAVVSSAIIAGTMLLDSRLGGLYDQMKVSNLLLGNIGELLRIPDFQKERQYYIEQGFKHYSNAKIDPDMFELALESFLKAEQLEKSDYVVLQRIGMIYLYSERHLNLDLAYDYLMRAAKFACVEAHQDGISAANILASNEDAKTPIATLASDILTKASFIKLLEGDVRQSLELSGKATSTDPSNISASIQHMHALIQSNLSQNAGNEALRILSVEPASLIPLADDDDLMSLREIRDAIDTIIRNQSSKKDRLKKSYSKAVLRFKNDLKQLEEYCKDKETAISQLESLSFMKGKNVIEEIDQYYFNFLNEEEFITSNIESACSFIEKFLGRLGSFTFPFFYPKFDDCRRLQEDTQSILAGVSSEIYDRLIFESRYVENLRNFVSKERNYIFDVKLENQTKGFGEQQELEFKNYAIDLIDRATDVLKQVHDDFDNQMNLYISEKTQILSSHQALISANKLALENLRNQMAQIDRPLKEEKKEEDKKTFNAEIADNLNAGTKKKNGNGISQDINSGRDKRLLQWVKISVVFFSLILILVLSGFFFANEPSLQRDTKDAEASELLTGSDTNNLEENPVSPAPQPEQDYSPSKFSEGFAIDNTELSGIDERSDSPEGIDQTVLVPESDALKTKYQNYVGKWKVNRGAWPYKVGGGSSVRWFSNGQMILNADGSISLEVSGEGIFTAKINTSPTEKEGYQEFPIQDCAGADTGTAYGAIFINDDGPFRIDCGSFWATFIGRG